MAPKPSLPPQLPPHLDQESDDESLKKKLAEKTADPTGEDARLSRMRQRDYTFQFNYTSKSGVPYSGTFTHQHPSVGQELAIESLRATWSGGAPWEALSPRGSELLQIAAHLTICLKDEGRPEWAKNLREILDADVLYKLYEEVTLHSRTFLGPR